jgi:transcriptional regulator with XRE-family HTH domain
MDDRDQRLKSLGEFIRAQRKMADLSLRQLAEIAEVSNPYLSQLEHGLHEPSVRVLQSIAKALRVSAETLLAHTGDEPSAPTTDGDQPSDSEAAIRNDPRLTDEQKRALLAVYRSYAQSNEPPPSD